MPRSLAPLALLLLLTACGGSGTKTTAPTPAPSQAGAPTSAAPAPSSAFSLTKLGSFDSPVWAGPAPGDPEHLFLVEKPGKVLVLGSDGKVQGTVLDLTSQLAHGNEQGLLSIAFDPSYPSNHRMYADMTIANGDTRVMAYTVTNGRAGAGQQLLAVDQPYANHNGGLLLFDRTGKLLVGLGDGGSGGDPQNHAQDLTSDLGKILRLEPSSGAAVPDNPYRENRKVWAYGLRNPWRFSFDTNGDLYVGDVGQDKVEELDVVPPAQQRGANYGWSVYEGTSRFKRDKDLQGGGSLIMPALTYTHASGGCSITGGEVYRGKALPQLVGHYVFGDYCAGKLLQVTRTSTGVTASTPLGLSVDGLQAFGHDANGELLVLSADSLYRIA
ncbi:MAG: sugar dehydrogenase [Frankiales bacterium]|nr:sugar dehydrogenase [Frankiales bacterium]